MVFDAGNTQQVRSLSLAPCVSSFPKSFEDAVDRPTHVFAKRRAEFDVWSTVPTSTQVTVVESTTAALNPRETPPERLSYARGNL